MQFFHLYVINCIYVCKLFPNKDNKDKNNHERIKHTPPKKKPLIMPNPESVHTAFLFAVRYFTKKFRYSQLPVTGRFLLFC